LTNWCKNQVVIRIPAFAQRKGEGLYAARKSVNTICIDEIGGPRRLEPPMVGGLMADPLKAIYRPKAEALDRSFNSLLKKATLENVEAACKIKAALGAVGQDV
jgi:hypothetical protein